MIQTFIGSEGSGLLDYLADGPADSPDHCQEHGVVRPWAQRATVQKVPVYGSDLFAEQNAVVAEPASGRTYRDAGRAERSP